MNALGQQQHYDFRQAVVRPVGQSAAWIKTFTVLQVLLIVPYASNALPWAYSHGIMPIRPAFYLILVGMLNLVLVGAKKPDFTITAGLFVTILTARALDAALLSRFKHPDGHDSAVISLAAAVFMAIVIFCSVGIMKKTTFLPAIIASALTIVLCVASILIEWLGFIDFTTVDGRFAGFAGDPNRACVYMNVMLGVFITLSRSFWANIAAIGVTAIGVLPTLSRGGMLILAMIVFAFALANLQRHGGKLALIAILAVPAVFAGIGILQAKGAKNGKVDNNVKDRIGAMFGGDVSGMQSDERVKDLEDGLNAVRKSPIFGMGTGAGTDHFQPHNQIVSLWIDLGLWGAFLYIAFLLTLCLKTARYRLRYACVLIPLVFYVPLSQALLENYAYFYGCSIAIILTSTRFIGFRLLRSRPPMDASSPINCS